MSTKIFLGTGGRAYGPFEDRDIEAMQSNGTFARFQWIWDESQRVWQPLDPAPAPIITPAGISKALPWETVSAPRPAAPKTLPRKLESPKPKPQVERPKSEYQEKVFQALCHNHSTVVSGSLRQYSDHEGELVCEDESAAPTLPTTIPLLLNLLDETSGEQSNLQATVTQIKRGQQGWHYTLKLSWAA